MNRSNKGFGLTGVFFAVVVLIVSAVLSTTATSAEVLTLSKAKSEKAKPADIPSIQKYQGDIEKTRG